MIGIRTWKYLDKLREKRHSKLGLLYHIEQYSKNSYELIGVILSRTCAVVFIGVLAVTMIMAISYWLWALIMWAIPDKPKPEPVKQGVSVTYSPDPCSLVDVYCDGEQEPVVGQASWLVYKLHDTCATRDWKKGTKLLVTNNLNGKSIVCYSRDYGPSKVAHPTRVIDLNRDQFASLAPISQGIIEVTVLPL